MLLFPLLLKVLQVQLRRNLRSITILHDSLHPGPQRVKPLLPHARRLRRQLPRPFITAGAVDKHYATVPLGLHDVN